MIHLGPDDVEKLTAGLEVLMDVQHEVSGKVKGAITDEIPTGDQTRTYFLAMIKETLELMDEFPLWKPWKESKEIAPDRVVDEFADVLAFLGVIINYIYTMGINPYALARGYASKTNVNQARFDGKVDGYRVRE